MNRASLDYNVIVNCMHCGLCLPHCPTYALTGEERSSPRGRIRLMKAVADGNLDLSETFIDEMEFCLDCQACETACPAGVRYGSLVEAARAMITEQGKESWVRRMTKKFFLDWILRRRTRLHMFAAAMRWIDRTGIRHALGESGIIGLFSARADALNSLMPAMSATFSSRELPAVLPPYGPRRFRVGFLTGCIMDVSFADVNRDTVELLRMHGCEVVVPPAQECCGSLHAHNGERESAKRLAAGNIAAFDDSSFDAIIMNSAGCGAFMKEYGHLFVDFPDLREKAGRISRKIKDITEFLAETGFSPSAPSAQVAGKRVTYHDACHMVHTQKIYREPRALFALVPAIDFVELPESSWCCGSAGIYNIVRHEDSMKLLDRKIRNVRSIAPDIVVTGNPGCVIQLEYGLRQAGVHTKVMHTSTFLRVACSG